MTAKIYNLKKEIIVREKELEEAKKAFQKETGILILPTRIFHGTKSSEDSYVALIPDDRVEYLKKDFSAFVKIKKCGDGFAVFLEIFRERRGKEEIVSVEFDKILNSVSHNMAMADIGDIFMMACYDDIKGLEIMIELIARAASVWIEMEEKKIVISFPGYTGEADLPDRCGLQAKK
jgi:hypothetical protein